MCAKFKKRYLQVFKREVKVFMIDTIETVDFGSFDKRKRYRKEGSLWAELSEVLASHV